MKNTDTNGACLNFFTYKSSEISENTFLVNIRKQLSKIFNIVKHKKILLGNGVVEKIIADELQKKSELIL
jgi:hypothetical protein